MRRASSSPSAACIRLAPAGRLRGFPRSRRLCRSQRQQLNSLRPSAVQWCCRRTGSLPHFRLRSCERPCSPASRAATVLHRAQIPYSSGISPGVRALFRSQRALTSERLPFGSAHMECYGQTHIGRERELVLCGNVHSRIQQPSLRPEAGKRDGHAHEIRALHAGIPAEPGAVARTVALYILWRRVMGREAAR
jgi:hypothetical protein